MRHEILSWAAVVDSGRQQRRCRGLVRLCWLSWCAVLAVVPTWKQPAAKFEREGVEEMLAASVRSVVLGNCHLSIGIGLHRKSFSFFFFFNVSGCYY